MLTSPGYLDNVDPARAFSLPDGQVAALTHDGLTGFRRVGGNAGLKLVPDLAVSIPTPTDGGLTYSFQLRPGIHYSNGALVRPRRFPARDRAHTRAVPPGRLLRAVLRRHRRCPPLPR